MKNNWPRFYFFGAVSVGIATFAGLCSKASAQPSLAVEVANLSSTRPSTNPEAWWQDPRWWAISATGLLSLLSLGIQWRYRIVDRREKSRGEAFDMEVRDPVRETFKELRALSVEVSAACDIADVSQRRDAIEQLRKSSACKALTCFSQSLYEAEQRLAANGSLSDLNASLEDVLYPELSVIANEQSVASLRTSARRISAAIITAMTGCDAVLSAARTRHVRLRKAK
jgi:hypothetical protein